MGLVERLQGKGISETELLVCVQEKTHDMLDFYLKATALEENGDKRYVYGPVSINENPGAVEHDYLNLLNGLAAEEDAERINVTEDDARMVIGAAQQKIEKYELAGITIANRDDFFSLE